MEVRAEVKVHMIAMNLPCSCHSGNSLRQPDEASGLYFKEITEHYSYSKVATVVTRTHLFFGNSWGNTDRCICFQRTSNVSNTTNTTTKLNPGCESKCPYCGRGALVSFFKICFIFLFKIIYIYNKSYIHNINICISINIYVCIYGGGTNGKKHASQYRRPMKHGFDPWVEKIPWRMA